MFQKTKYAYDFGEKKLFMPLTFPTNHSVQHYLDWRGYQQDADILVAEQHFGKNV